MLPNEPRNVLYLEIARVLLRSWWTAVAGVCLGLAGALFVLEHSEKIFEATARLNLDAEQFPKEFFRDTVAGDENVELRLSVIRTEVLNARSLDRIIDEVVGPDTPTEERDRLMGMIRARSDVRAPRWGQVFEIRFMDSDPVRAADIANLLAQEFVEQNLELRKQGATETVDTLQGLVDAKDAERQAKRNEINEYKRTHRYDPTVNTVEIRDDLAVAEADLERVRDGIRKLRDQIDVAEIQVGQAPLIVPPPSAGEKTVVTTGSASARLAVLEQQLQELRARYTDDHPDVVAKKAEIDRLRSETPEEPPPLAGASTPSERPSGGAVDYGDVRLGILQGQLDALLADEARLERRAGEYRRLLANLPEVAAKVDEMERELEIIDGEYRAMRTNLEDAKSTQLVEQQGRGSQFEIISMAAPPSAPISPNPLFLLGAGAAIGFAMFVGPVAAKAILMPVITSESRLAAITKLPILTTIPPLLTADVARRKRAFWIRNLGLAALSVSVLAVVVGLRWAGGL